MMILILLQAGNPFNIDREQMAKELGFEGLLMNSMEAVSSRDFVLEAMQWGSMMMTHMSRWAEDLIIYRFAALSLTHQAYSNRSLVPKSFHLSN
jgi:argininosuccinate lyase